MQKNHKLRTILLSTVFALLAIALMTPAASAHTATSAHGAATATSQIPANGQNVNIVTKHGKAVFTPNVVHCNAQDFTKPCFTLTNTTNVPQGLIVQGNTFNLWPGEDLKFIFGPGVITFGLKSNRHAHLTIITS